MNISEHSKIWIYQSNRPLSPDEAQKIQESLNSFTSQWLAHGHLLAGKGEIRYNQFIILSIDEQLAGATGCSIDASVKLMLEFETQFDIRLFDRFLFAYREGGNIVTCNKEKFEEYINSGKINSETIVFNNLITTRKELLSKWEVPLKESWHKLVFAVN